MAGAGLLALRMQARYSGPVELDALVECDTFDEPVYTPPHRPDRQVLDGTLSGISYLDCSTTLDPERGKLYLSLVNQHPDDAIEVSIEIPEMRVQSEGTIHELYHSDGLAMNTPSDPDNVKSVTLTLEIIGAAKQLPEF